MRIGASIFLMVIGAILTFAVHLTVSGLDLRVVGWILMVAGAAGAIVYFAYWNRARPTRAALVAERRAYDETPRPPL